MVHITYTLYSKSYENLCETQTKKKLLLTDNPFQWRQTLKESVSQWVEIKKWINLISGQIFTIGSIDQ